MWMASMYNRELDESFEVHDNLNPILFDNDKLKQDIRAALLKISNSFIDSIWIKPEVLDVQLVGSNASYNYTNQSDIDLHLIVNFETLDAPQEVLNALYNLEKTQFNKDHDIFLKGIPVEVYIEDVNTNAVSNGVYSVLKDEWIKYPRKIISIPHYDFSREISIWKNKILDTLKSGSSKEVSDLINVIYMIRKNSISIDGEFGKGNQLFKEIRNEGLLDLLKNKLKEIKSKELSLESFLENHTVDEMFNIDFKED